MTDSAICHSMSAFMVFVHQLDLFVFWVLRLTGTAGIIKPLAKALEIHKFLHSPLCLLSCSYTADIICLFLFVCLYLCCSFVCVCVCFIWRVHDKVTMCAGCASVCLWTSPQLSAMEVWQTNTHHMSYPCIPVFYFKSRQNSHNHSSLNLSRVDHTWTHVWSHRAAQSDHCWGLLRSFLKQTTNIRPLIPHIPHNSESSGSKH